MRSFRSLLKEKVCGLNLVIQGDKQISASEAEKERSKKVRCSGSRENVFLGRKSDQCVHCS